MNPQSTIGSKNLTQQANVEKSVFKVMGLDAEQSPKLNLTYRWALSGVGFWLYNDENDSEYSDFEIDSKFEYNENNSNDPHTFNLHITFNWVDQNVNLALGTNFGDGFNFEELVAITATKPWGESIQEKIELLEEGSPYLALIQEHPSAFNKIVLAANELYEAMITKVAACDTKYVGSHTFKSTDDLNDYEPAIVFGGSSEGVSDLITQQALENTLFANTSTLIPELITTVVNNESGSFDEAFCGYFKNAQDTLNGTTNEAVAIQLISENIKISKDLSDIAFEAMLEAERIEGRSNIVAIQ